MQTFLLILTALWLVALVNSDSYAYFSSCGESDGRQCPYITNRTEYLLNLKKGGTNILSTDVYMNSFFLCEEYNYDCGYMEKQGEPLTIANGVELEHMTEAYLDEITTLSSTKDKIMPYIGLTSEEAQCGSKLFPLELTPAQSNEVLDGHLKSLEGDVEPMYESCRFTSGNTTATLAWSSLNINIRTSILSTIKGQPSLLGDSIYWNNVCKNNFTGVSQDLKEEHVNNKQTIELHQAYLIDSVTQKCNKTQSINFLVDESGSIGAASFVMAIEFLEMYINTTLDDLSLMRIDFFGTDFVPYIGYGNDYDYMLNMIQNKIYGSTSTNTNRAVIASVDRVLQANYPKGLPKIIAVLTDGASQEVVVQSAAYAQQNDITILAIGIGAGIDYPQLLQLAGNPSNIILIQSYADLPKLVDFITNYFCKQIVTIELDQTIEGNFVRVPQSPSYFRVIKGVDEYYELDVYFEDDPVEHNQELHESQFDPFPDRYTEYTTSEYYQIFYTSRTSSSRALTAVQESSNALPPLVQADFVPMKVFFIQPQNDETIVIKKNKTMTISAAVSYVAVRGNDIGFNISLKRCNSSYCLQQRQYYKSLSESSSPITIYSPDYEDFTIFIGIGCTLGALLLCCGFIFCVAKRRNQQEEQKKKKRSSENSENTKTDELFDENLIPANTNQKLSRSNHSSKRSKKSSMSSQTSKMS